MSNKLEVAKSAAMKMATGVLMTVGETAAYFDISPVTGYSGPS